MKKFFLYFLLFLSVLLPIFLLNPLAGVAINELLCRAAVIVFIILFLLLLCQSTKKGWLKTVYVIFSGIIFFAMIVLQILEFYNMAFAGETFNISFYMAMADTEMVLAMIPSQWKQISACFIYLLFTTVVFSFSAYYASKLKIKHPVLQKIIPAAMLLIVIALHVKLPNPAVNFAKMLSLARVDNSSGGINFNELKKYGITHCPITKETLKIYNRGTGKNFVFIILESMEKGFLDEKLFPGLTPNLNRLRQDKKTLFFDNITDSGHATAPALFQLMYGMPPTPLTAATGGMGRPNVAMMKNFVGLPFLFTKSGYSWTHIEQLGSLPELFNLENAKTDFEKEFFAQVEDVKYFLDMYTFDYATKAFNKRAAEKKPFAISLVTIDAHFPNGYVNEKTLKYPQNQQKSQIFDAIYNCDTLLGKFVDDIMTSPQGKNTVIVITNDHLFMSKIPQFRNYKRQNFLMVINSGMNGINSTPGCQLDVPATITDIFKIKSNHTFPCGESLLGNTKMPLSQRMSSRTAEGIITLNNYISAKSQKKKIDKNTISVTERSGTYFLNCFGNEIVIENVPSIFTVSFSGDSIVNAGYVRHFSQEREIKTIKNNLNSKREEIFLFYGKSDTNNIIIDKLDIDSIPVEWALVYKDKQGRFQAVLRSKLEDLKLDKVEDKDKQSLNISYQRRDSIKFNADAFFHDKEIKILDDNSFSISGRQTHLYSARSFQDKQIGFSAKVKNSSDVPCNIFYGFMPLDKNGKHLEHILYPANDKVKCAKIVTAAAGQKSIIVSGDTSGWGKGMSLVKNAKEDYSDIPNNGFIGQIVSVKKLADGNSEIILNSALTENIAQGTLARPHGKKHTYLYSGVKRLDAGKSTDIQACIQKSDFPFFSVKFLPRGCENVRLIIFSFSTGQKAHTIEISNFNIIR